MTRQFLWVLMLFVPSAIFAQDTARPSGGASPDSVLRFREFLDLVQLYHPVSVQADLQVDRAERNMRMARGGFDPVLYGKYRTKEYELTEYYNALEAGLNIPTWFGLSFQAGYQENSGVYLNPESLVPEAGLINAGITAELGAGLLMDSRRAAFRQAEIAESVSLSQRLIMLNNLYYEATRAYANWSLGYMSVRVAGDALALASERYEGVRQSYTFGDLPAIDTVEAYTQVLSRLYALREAENNLIDGVNLLNVFLWNDAGEMVFIRPGLVPDWIDFQSAGEIMDIPLLTATHPELRIVEFKRASLDIDRRLAAEYLRPKVQLKYNFLTENVLPAPADDFFQQSRFFENNYTFGASVSLPLFVREARGKLGMTKIALESVDLDFEIKQAQLQTKINALFGKLQNIRDQIGFYTENVALLERMIAGEQELFGLGESSLFLVNTRETNLIKAQNELNALIVKEQMMRAELRVVAGVGF